MVECLSALDVDGTRTPVGVFKVKRYGVAVAEFVIAHTDEGGGVKERVFLLTFDGNEAEPLVRQSGDCTGHRFVQ